jgi:hypothetical protein
MYYKLICILYALLCGQNFILVKSGCYTHSSLVAAATSMGDLNMVPMGSSRLMIAHQEPPMLGESVRDTLAMQAQDAECARLCGVGY